MALNRQIVPVQFSQGLDTSVDPKEVGHTSKGDVTAPAMHRLVNGYFDKQGSVSKRFGTAQLGAEQNANCDRIVEWNGKTIIFGSAELRQWDGTSSFTQIDALDLWSTRYQTVVGVNGKYGLHHDAVEVDSTRVVTHIIYDDSLSKTITWVTAQDLTTGEVTASQAIGSTTLSSYLQLFNSPLAAVASAHRVWGFLINSSDGKIYSYSVNTQTGAVSSLSDTTLSVTLPGLGAAFAHATLETCVVGTTVCLVYYDGTNLKLATFNGSTGALVTSATVGGAPGASMPYCFAACPVATTRVIVVYSDSGAVKARAFNVSGLTEYMSETTLLTDRDADGHKPLQYGCVESATNHVEVLVTMANATGVHIRRQAVTISGGAGTAVETTSTVHTARFAPNFRLAARPVYDGTMVRFWSVGRSDVEGALYMVAYDPTKTNSQLTVDHAVYASEVDGSMYLCAQAMRDRALLSWDYSAYLLGLSHSPLLQVYDYPDSDTQCFGAAEGLTSVAIVRFNRPDVSPSCTSTEAGLLIASSLPLLYDGIRITEMGFCHPPVVTAVSNSTGGSLDSSVLYGFIATYEWQDSLGRIHQSGPSAVRTITTTGNAVTVTVEALHATRKPGARVVVWRTESDGSTYYRVADKTLTGSEATVSFAVTDDELNDADTSISSNAQLLQNGVDENGVLINIGPPVSRVVAKLQDRLFIVPEEYAGTRVWYSKIAEAGYGPELNSGLSFSVFSDGGDITALSAHNEKLLIFKRDRVLVTHGVGLDNNGLGNNYQQPYEIADAIGCTNARSVVKTPVGTMFLGSDGIITLVDYNMAVTPIGLRMRHYTSDAVDCLSWDITAAVCSTVDNHVLFFTAQSNGECLVYNYRFDQWSIWHAHGAIDAALVGTEIQWLNGDGEVWEEARDSYLDGADDYSLTATTGWLSFGGVAGFERVRYALVIGQNLSAHKLRVKIGYDYDPVWTDTLESNIGLSTSATVTSGASETFTLVEGDTLIVCVDGGAPQTITFHANNFVDIAAATAAEVALVVDALTGATSADDSGSVVITSATTGASSKILVTGGTANAVLGFPTELAQGVTGTGVITVADHWGAGISSTYADQVYIAEAAGSRQKCASIRYEISDQPVDEQTDLGRSLSLSGLALVVGVKPSRGMPRGNGRVL